MIYKLCDIALIALCGGLVLVVCQAVFLGA